MMDDWTQPRRDTFRFAINGIRKHRELLAERDRLRRIVERVANSPKVDVSGAGSHFDALIPCDVVREALGGGDGR